MIFRLAATLVSSWPGNWFGFQIFVVWYSAVVPGLFAWLRGGFTSAASWLRISRFTFLVILPRWVNICWLSAFSRSGPLAFLFLACGLRASSSWLLVWSSSLRYLTGAFVIVHRNEQLWHFEIFLQLFDIVHKRLMALIRADNFLVSSFLSLNEWFG